MELTKLKKLLWLNRIVADSSWQHVLIWRCQELFCVSIVGVEYIFMQVPFLLLLGLMGLAGALGSVARYLLSHFIAGRAGSAFPFGTLFINVSGSLLIGVLFGLTARHVLSTSSQLVLATGFLGGYTTFGTMSWEGVQLARSGNLRASVLYFGESVLLGLLAASAGIALGWWL
jgi:fluoride exporter